MSGERIDSAMVLAAGFGTRMRPLTDTRPKALVEVAGRALVDHALDRVAEAGIFRAVVNLHYLGDMLRAHLAQRQRPSVAFSEETPQILDTGGGVVHALGQLGERPFAVLNSDAIWTGAAPVAALVEAWGEIGAWADGLLLMVQREAALGYTRAGDFFLDGLRPVRRGDAARAPYVFTGAQILRPAALADAPEGPFSLNLVWDRLNSAGRLGAVVHRGAWVDVGTPAGIVAAEAAIADDARGARR